MGDKVFQQFYNRLVKEAFLNSLFGALIIGFATMAAAAAIFWLTGFDYPWLAFIVMAVVVGGVTPLLYYTKFRPSKKELAKRVDALGLEERLLTMEQLKDDDSYLAKRQREDAKAAIASLESKLLKLAISLPLIIVASVMIPLGLGMTTVAIASEQGMLPSGNDIINSATEPELPEYEVEFVEDGPGIVDGELLQFVKEGDTIMEVFAMPDEDAYLVAWVWEINGEEFTLEGSDVFFVEDLVVEQDMLITAVFAEIGEGGDQDGEKGESDQQGKPQEGDGEKQEKGESEEEGQKQKPMPKPDGEKQDKDNKEEKPPEDTEADPDDKESNQESDDRTDSGDGSINDMIIDGQTDYGKYYDEAYKDAMDAIENDETLTEEEKQIIKDYFENIKK